MITSDLAYHAYFVESFTVYELDTRGTSSKAKFWHK
jgi:hypothetical protein